jgi:hypothetical protein
MRWWPFVGAEKPGSVPDTSLINVLDVDVNVNVEHPDGHDKD